MSRRPENPYVLCPDVSVERVAPGKGEMGTVRVANPAHQSGVSGPVELLTLLAALKTPRTLGELCREFELDEAFLDELVEKWILLPADEAMVLGPGLARRSTAGPLGLACSYAQLREVGTPRSFAVLGAPVDLLGTRGANAGPAEVRRCSVFRNVDESRRPDDERKLPEDFEALDIDLRRRHFLGPKDRQAVLDAGDVVYVPGEPVAHVGRRIEVVVTRIVERGITPVMIGGDHGLSWFPLKVLLERVPKLGIIHFDAHHDLYPASDQRPLSHANPFLHACQERGMVRLHQLGLRTLEGQRATRLETFRDRRITYHSAFELQTLTPRQAFAGLDRKLPYYLSFDVDCIRPEVAGETGTPVVGGLSYYQAFSLVRYAIENFRLVGADFVEVASSEARFNYAAAVTGRLMDLLLLSRVRSERLSTYLRRRPSWSESRLTPRR